DDAKVLRARCGHVLQNKFGMIYLGEVMNYVGDIIFGVAVLAIILYGIFWREKNANISQLTEVKRWYFKRYITKTELSEAIGEDGNMTIKSYNKLKAKVDRLRLLRTLTDEKSEKPKVP